MAAFEPSLGAIPLGGGRCRFRVWAPSVPRLAVRLLGARPRVVPLARDATGHHEAVAENVPPGTRYLLELPDGRERPDPCSRLQPEGVHGPSEVVDPAFAWTDGGWRGMALEDLVLYEVHVGAFTEAGTLDAAAARLEALAELGVTAVELMPVSEFPGARNWGYDGVQPFSVHHAYGGPAALSRFVDAAHAQGLAVVLDVVHNHLGPEGNYTGELAPYYRGHTPWGPALDFDGPSAVPVRRFFIESALSLLHDHHLDGLRLDAVHVIAGRDAGSFLAELGAAVHELAGRLGRPLHVIAETPHRDPPLTLSRTGGGCGLDAQWCDDLHHALHARLTGERGGYYATLGRLSDVAAALRQRGPLVVYAQDHDQVGNRPGSERLGSLVSFEALKLAAGAVLLSPFLPLLFMGEEWAEPAPFHFFTSYGDAALARAVREGRTRDLARFRLPGEPPDPQRRETFLASRPHPELCVRPPHAELRALFRALLRARREVAALAPFGPATVEADEARELVVVRRHAGGSRAVVLLHFGARPRTLEPDLAGPGWRVHLDTADARFGGPGGRGPEHEALGERPTLTLAPTSCVLLVRG